MRSHAVSNIISIVFTEIIMERLRCHFCERSKIKVLLNYRMCARRQKVKQFNKLRKETLKKGDLWYFLSMVFSMVFFSEIQHPALSREQQEFQGSSVDQLEEGKARQVRFTPHIIQINIEVRGLQQSGTQIIVKKRRAGRESV